MDIDFIKWMCEKAEYDFEKRSMKSGIQVFVGVDKDFQGVNIESDFYEVYIYPLLLHRAIEGVNREDDGYRIEQCYNQIDICDTEEYNCLTVYEYDNGIDAAKESALRYVYEQEKK